MPMCMWRIDEPRVRASGNPSDEDFARLRAQCLGVLVLLLGDRESPRYDRSIAATAGWRNKAV